MKGDGRSSNTSTSLIFAMFVACLTMERKNVWKRRMGEWVMTERGLCNMVHGCEGNQEDDIGMIVVLGKEKCGQRKERKRPLKEERL